MFSRGAKTFRPVKNFTEGTMRYELHKKATVHRRNGIIRGRILIDGPDRRHR